MRCNQNKIVCCSFHWAWFPASLRSQYSFHLKTSTISFNLPSLQKCLNTINPQSYDNKYCGLHFFQKSSYYHLKNDAYFVVPFSVHLINAIAAFRVNMNEFKFWMNKASLKTPTPFVNWFVMCFLKSKRKIGRANCNRFCGDKSSQIDIYAS